MSVQYTEKEMYVITKESQNVVFMIKKIIKEKGEKIWQNLMSYYQLVLLFA